MKPLTIEELKSLEVGDWVWGELKDKFTLKCNDVIYDYKCSNKSLYFQVANTCDNADKLILLTPYEDYSLFLSYSDYGTTWLAYKNKEAAEGKDEEIRKQTAKEILQDFMGLPTCQHPTIGTGQFMFGKKLYKRTCQKIQRGGRR